jgi:hypothetical protein
MITELNFQRVRERYDARLNSHLSLRTQYAGGIVNASTYIASALGITDAHANYSASEHNLGPLILGESGPERIFQLAQRLGVCQRNHVPRVIYEAEIPYLKISVGSEIAMMLRPDEIWVGNRRTYWTHILVKNDWRRGPANEALELFRENEPNAEMDYRVWQYLYLDIAKSLEEVATRGEELAKLHNIEPGHYKFLWADAIATSLYEIRNNL